METLIAVLPSHVVDQIAAGEVIERPASVVKELVDNAIDAGARTISTETVAGGRTLIRVVDDGRGMSPRDAVIAFERHATSKLRAVDDLWGLATMGFRGEALPSIASVARVTLTTRQAGDLAATRVEIAGGKLVAVGEVGAPVGTCIEVADLLYNLPARLKFLKGEATEASHITELVGKLAMSHPQLHLRLRHSGRVALDTPPDLDGFARAQALLGPRISSRMVSVHGEESGIRVSAYLGAPELAQTTARGVQLFVGRRAIRDRGVLHALAMGYGELVPRGRYPLAIVLLDAPPGAVDFNVHPQKLEVRFADPGAVAAAVRHVVQAGIARAPWRDEIGGAGPVMMTAIASVAPPRLPLDAPATSLAATYAAQLREARARPQASLGFEAPDGANAGARRWAQQIKDQVRSARAIEAKDATRSATALYRLDAERHDANRAARDVAATEAAGAAYRLSRPDGNLGGALGDLGGALMGEAARAAHPGVPPVDDIGSATTGRAAMTGRAALDIGDAIVIDESMLAEGSTPAASPGFFSSLRYLGQLDLTYLMCEGEGELVLIDQHVAHERVELARLKAGHAERAVQTQRLLFPTTIAVEPSHATTAAAMRSVLADVGYDVEVGGGAAPIVSVSAVPSAIRHGDPTQLLVRLLASWAEDGAPTERERTERVLAEIACHSVVRAGDRLAPSEAEALLRSMDGADFSGHGPHNRPVMLRMSLADIARQFKR